MTNILADRTEEKAKPVDLSNNLDFKFMEYLYSLDVLFYEPKVNCFGYYAEINSGVVAHSFTSFEKTKDGLYLVFLSVEDAALKLLELDTDELIEKYVNWYEAGNAQKMANHYHEKLSRHQKKLFTEALESSDLEIEAKLSIALTLLELTI